ncbi:MAG: sodium:proton antiporter [Ardenticatenaceae bacterium]|nr:sodium:proton antiporter [Ardenticatenaceae bacterium]MCB8947070.1 sodium:proton antiporter [Ardenticatenaceae bacterium]
MHEQLLIGIAAVIILGVFAQWLAWRLRLPSILLLLIIGLVAGPVTGLLSPEAVLGELLFPMVSLAVGYILYEGGLSLRVKELREVGGVVFSLTSIGVTITWVLGAVAARYLLQLSWPIAILLTAVLVVTGPTVIGPLLRQIRPKGKTLTILKWEGILIDPIGAVLAVLVFEAILSGQLQQAPLLIARGVLLTALIGTGIGLLAAGVMWLLLSRYWVPDQLQNGVSLLFVTLAFVASDLLHPESGLLAVTVMGFALANQRQVPIKQIEEFKKSVRDLLIGGLFIVLAARLSWTDFAEIVWWRGALFVAFLVLLVRPTAVFIATLRADLSLKEKVFLSWMAPRGIVAAAVASLFALRLEEAGFDGAESLVALTFLVILSTVVIYGLTASPLAKWLGISEDEPQGVLFMGAHHLARELALLLQGHGVRVGIIDSNWRNHAAARMAGLKSYYGNALDEEVLENLDLSGIGRFLAMTSNDEANALASLHFAETFGSSGAFQLQSSDSVDSSAEQSKPRHLHGRILFQPALTYAQLDALFAGGAQLKSTSITQEFTYEDFQKQHPGTAVSLCLLQKTGKLTVFSADTDLVPKPGDTLISLLTVPEQQAIVENGMSKNMKAKQIVAEKKSSRGEKLPATL